MYDDSDLNKDDVLLFESGEYQGFVKVATEGMVQHLLGGVEHYPNEDRADFAGSIEVKMRLFTRGYEEEFKNSLHGAKILILFAFAFDKRYRTWANEAGVETVIMVDPPPFDYIKEDNESVYTIPEGEFHKWYRETQDILRAKMIYYSLIGNDQAIPYVVSYTEYNKLQLQRQSTDEFPAKISFIKRIARCLASYIS